MIKLSEANVELFAKLEFLNGVGSIKDRPAFWILKSAIERGEIDPDSTVIESSSGNFACALATFCRILGLRFIPVIDPVTPPLYEQYLRSICKEVVKVDSRDSSGGYLLTRLNVVRELTSQISNSYWPNQYQNPDGMKAHYIMTASEIQRGVRDLNYVFIGVSSAGTIAGVSRRLKECNPGIRIVAVDVEGSAIFGKPPKRRQLSGLGSSISPPLIMEALVDEIVTVRELDSVAGCNELFRHHGLFVGASSGASYSAIKTYFHKRHSQHFPKVLFLCCDRGTAYLHNIYDPEWVAANLK